MNDPSTDNSNQAPGGSRQPVHVPVLLQETLQLLELQPGQVVVDGTVGAGGHARAIAVAIAPGGTLVGLDRDSEILDLARAALAPAATVAGAEVRVSLHHLPYAHMRDALTVAGLSGCDRVLLDLGVSSLQLDRPERGFSFMVDGPLDMRMDAGSSPSAAEWLAEIGERELADTLFRFGDERFSRRIARQLVQARQQAPIVRTRQLAELIRAAMPGPARHGRIHPATRSFQAIRMAVNDELGELERGLQAAFDCLQPGGRLAVISFHSAEDRLVKHWMRAHCQVLTKKPIEAGEQELAVNPRARSAKLRCAQKPGEVS
jgi:16S rRNA (cytosine1402-N4)-methyltransferase